MQEKQTRESSDPYYDLIDDFGLVVSSFQSQYGLRLSRDLSTMKWDEFCDLISGLGPETPLGRIVSIRAENNKETLKHFTKEQHRIRREWRNRHVVKVSETEMQDILEQFKQAFVCLAGGEENCDRK